MSAPALGLRFGREIREVPAVWKSVAAGDRAERVARLSMRRVSARGRTSLFDAGGDSRGSLGRTIARSPLAASE